MAGITFSIGGTNFTALDSTSGRHALGVRATNPHYDVKRFHPPGVDGQYVVRCGRLGQTFIFRARYVGTLANVFAYIETDRNAWANAAITLIDDHGTTYTVCNLIDFVRLGDPVFVRVVGADRFVYVDCQISFTWDGGV